DGTDPRCARGRQRQPRRGGARARHRSHDALPAHAQARQRVAPTCTSLPARASCIVMSYAMTRAEREAFLAETRVGVLSVSDDGRGPVIAPVWYHYEPGGMVRVVTGRNSQKGRLLRAAGRMSLCVQTETAPYQYVTVEGRVTLSEPDYERDVRAMALR